MKKRTIKGIISGQNVEKAEERFLEEAEKLDLLDNYDFLTAYKNYHIQLEIMDILLEQIKDKDGAGDDISNAVGKYNQAGGQADKFLTKIRAIISDRRKELPAKSEEAGELI